MSFKEEPELELKLNLSPLRGSKSDSSGSSCVSREVSLDKQGSSENQSMILFGCPRCLMYVMLSADDPKCPKCKSTVLLDFLLEEPKRGLNK